MQQIEQALQPVEIASIYMLYHRAETFHVKFPQTTHAHHSIIKSFLGCSGYHREQFDFAKYRLKLHHVRDITDEQMFELARLITPFKDRQFSQTSLARSDKFIKYNIAGYLIIEIDFNAHCIKLNGLERSVLNESSIRLDLGYQYLVAKNFDMPVYLGEDHPLNGKTPTELGVAVLID